MTIIFKKWQVIWNQPFLFLSKKQEKWKWIIVPNLFTVVFLIVFQPFGVNNYDPTHQISWPLVLGTIWIGLCNGIVMAIYEFGMVPFIFPKPTLGQFFTRIALLLLLLSCSTFWSYNYLGGFHDWYFASFLGFIRDVSLTAIIPLSTIFLYFKYQTEAIKNKTKIFPLNHDLIWLLAENQKDKLGVTLATLLLVEAQDNYVAIYQELNGQVKKKLLRTSLKNIEQQLSNTSLKRCHRSYLVNLKQVKQAKGNAHQYQLYLNGWEQPIPVSRNYISKILSLLDSPPK